MEYQEGTNLDDEALLKTVYESGDDLGDGWPGREAPPVDEINLPQHGQEESSHNGIGLTGLGCEAPSLNESGLTRLGCEAPSVVEINLPEYGREAPLLNGITLTKEFVFLPGERRIRAARRSFAVFYLAKALIKDGAINVKNLVKLAPQIIENTKRDIEDLFVQPVGDQVAVYVFLTTFNSNYHIAVDHFALYVEQEVCHARVFAFEGKPPREAIKYDVETMQPIFNDRLEDRPRGQVQPNGGQIQSTSGRARSTRGQLRSTSGRPQSTGCQIQSTSGRTQSTCGEVQSTSGRTQSTSGEVQSTSSRAQTKRSLKRARVLEEIKTDEMLVKYLFRCLIEGDDSDEVHVEAVRNCSTRMRGMDKTKIVCECHVNGRIIRCPSPLHMTCALGKFEMTMTLIHIDKQLDWLDCVDANGHNPFHYAATNGHLEIVRRLWKMSMSRPAKAKFIIATDNENRNAIELREAFLGGGNPLAIATIPGADPVVKFLKEIFEEIRLGENKKSTPKGGMPKGCITCESSTRSSSDSIDRSTDRQIDRSIRLHWEMGRASSALTDHHLGEEKRLDERMI